MSSQRPVTYRELFKAFAERDNKYAPMDFRRETQIIPRDEDGPIVFDAFLYRTLIASLYPDGTVRLWGDVPKTNTTKNRMNDFIIPLGWKLVLRNGEWTMYSTITKAYSEYINDMLVRPVVKANR